MVNEKLRLNFLSHWAGTCSGHRQPHNNTTANRDHWPHATWQEYNTVSVLECIGTAVLSETSLYSSGWFRDAQETLLLMFRLDLKSPAADRRADSLIYAVLLSFSHDLSLGAVCVRACVYPCVHVCTRVCVHVCVCVYLHACVCVCVCLHAFVLVCIYACTCTCVWAMRQPCGVVVKMR